MHCVDKKIGPRFPFSNIICLTPGIMAFALQQGNSLLHWHGSLALVADLVVND